jgi:hypothetical protein
MIASLPSSDPDNNHIYSVDPGLAKVFGIDLNQKTGYMTLAWSVDRKTLVVSKSYSFTVDKTINNNSN